MKRVLALLLVLTASCGFYLTGCKMPEDSSSEVKYYDEYTYNENYHWRNQIDGDGLTDYEEHSNEKGKCKCGMYYECPDIEYEIHTVYGKTGYCVMAYNGANPYAYEHIEIPAFHQEDDDLEPVPVIAIAGDVFSTVEHSSYKAIKSVKLNEGLLFLGNGAFEGTAIEKVVIPNSVIGGCLTYDLSKWPYHGGLYNVFAACSLLTEVDTGDGIEVIGMYTFSYCDALKTVKYGRNVKEIRQRAFYEAYGYENVVLPATVVSLPEGSYFDLGDTFDENNNNDLQRWLSEVNVFPFAKKVFLSITKEEHKQMSLKLMARDIVTGMPYNKDGELVEPVNHYETFTDYGYVEGWCGWATIYFSGEWYYDDYGNPVPNV